MRRGHISAAQKRALDESLPQYQIEYAPELLDADKAFGRHAPLVLEIGCGMGETTAAIAQAHPEVNFLGCEVFVAGRRRACQASRRDVPHQCAHRPPRRR